LFNVLIKYLNSVAELMLLYATMPAGLEVVSAEEIEELGGKVV